MKIMVGGIVIVFLGSIFVKWYKNRKRNIYLKQHLELLAYSDSSPVQSIILFGKSYVDVARQLNSKKHSKSRVVSRISYRNGMYAAVLERKIIWDDWGVRYV
jgi:hypothetical protein